MKNNDDGSESMIRGDLGISILRTSMLFDSQVRMRIWLVDEHKNVVASSDILAVSQQPTAETTTIMDSNRGSSTQRIPQTGTSLNDIDPVDPAPPSTNNNENNNVDNQEFEEESEEEDEEQQEQQAAPTEEELAKLLGCAHYKRNCLIIAPCCGKEFHCRHCHNESEPSHEIDRFSVSEIRCRVCSTRQPVSNQCTHCGIQFAHYFCSKCKFWENTPNNKIYHCDKCGICRVGDQNSFFHCDICGMDFHRKLFEKHKCISNSGKSDCPVCLENIFFSRVESTLLKCGHIMHIPCFNQLLEFNMYMCPLCNRSMIDMSSYFREIDQAVSAIPMPNELRQSISILCNDCLWKGEGQFHFYGTKCGSCGSYNTVKRK